MKNLIAKIKPETNIDKVRKFLKEGEFIVLDNFGTFFLVEGDDIIKLRLEESGWFVYVEREQEYKALEGSCVLPGKKLP